MIVEIDETNKKLDHIIQAAQQLLQVQFSYKDRKLLFINNLGSKRYVYRVSI